MTLTYDSVRSVFQKIKDKRYRVTSWGCVLLGSLALMGLHVGTLQVESVKGI